MKLISWNVNGIRATIGKGLGDFITAERPDILCLQETKVQDQDFPVAPFQDAGFHVTFRGQKAHAGKPAWDSVEKNQSGP